MTLMLLSQSGVLSSEITLSDCEHLHAAGLRPGHRPSGPWLGWLPPASVLAVRHCVLSLAWRVREALSSFLRWALWLSRLNTPLSPLGPGPLLAPFTFTTSAWVSCVLHALVASLVWVWIALQVMRQLSGAQTKQSSSTEPAAFFNQGLSGALLWRCTRQGAHRPGIYCLLPPLDALCASARKARSGFDIQAYGFCSPACSLACVHPQERLHEHWGSCLQSGVCCEFTSKGLLLSAFGPKYTYAFDSQACPRSSLCHRVLQQAGVKLRA